MVRGEWDRFSCPSDARIRLLPDGFKNRRETHYRAFATKSWTITLENGQDPVAFIISANIQGRHLTKGDGGRDGCVATF
jgi:hypothetical protein